MMGFPGDFDLPVNYVREILTGSDSRNNRIKIMRATEPFDVSAMSPDSSTHIIKPIQKNCKTSFGISFGRSCHVAMTHSWS